MCKWYFDRQGSMQDVWVWRQMSNEGTLLQISKHTFHDYLTCAVDARRHGYDGRPHFRPALRREDAAANACTPAIMNARGVAGPVTKSRQQ